MLHVSENIYALHPKRDQGMDLKNKVLYEEIPGETISVSKKQIQLCVIKCWIDAVIVGGIVFCASVPVLGFEDLHTNVCLAGYSSMFTGGLTFFSEMRTAMKQIFR